MSSRAQQNIKLTKLFTKCSTNPAVKCLIIEGWEIQDDIRDHLPDRSETLECLKLSPGLIQRKDMLKEVLKRLINLQQLVISDQHSLDDIPLSSRISKENYLKCSLKSLPNLKDLEIDVQDDEDSDIRINPVNAFRRIRSKLERLVFGGYVTISHDDIVLISLLNESLKHFSIRNRIAQVKKVMCGACFIASELETLHLASVSATLPFDLNQVCRYYHKLTALDFTNGVHGKKQGLLDKHLQLIGNKICNLAYLCIEGHRKVTAGAVCEMVCKLSQLHVLIVDISNFSEETQVDRLLCDVEAHVPHLYSILQVKWLNPKILLSSSKVKYVNAEGALSQDVLHGSRSVEDTKIVAKVTSKGQDEIIPIHPWDQRYEEAKGTRFFMRKKSYNLLELGDC